MDNSRASQIVVDNCYYYFTKKVIALRVIHELHLVKVRYENLFKVFLVDISAISTVPIAETSISISLLEGEIQ